jgi:Outer membrane protein beta-barrel domain
MRTLILAAAIAAAPAAAMAQTPRAYISGAGGFATTTDGTSGDVVGEAGVHVAPHVFVFADVGRFHNLEPSVVQPTIDAATQTLSANGVDVTGSGRVPAWYSSGGVRVQIPARGRVTPYVFGSLGVAHLTPQATFSYTSGTLGDTTPTAGDDVTSQVVSLGDFTQPASTNALMLSGGAGIEAPIAKHLVLDAGYRASRVNADTPLHTQGLTFGVGYRF